MMSDLIKHALRWLLIITLQLAIFNNIQFLGILNPFVYIFVILVLPLGMPRAALLLFAFVTGLTIDVFSNTGGLHAGTATLMAFIRPYWVKVAIPRSNYDDLQNIRIKDIEFGQFLTYAAVLVVVHHFTLYVFESLQWSQVGWILGKTLMNSVFSLGMILSFRYFDLSQASKS